MPTRRAARHSWPITIVDRDGPDTARRQWSRRSPRDRVAAVSFLRGQYFAARGYKKPPRLERIVMIRDRRG